MIVCRRRNNVISFCHCSRLGIGPSSSSSKVIKASVERLRNFQQQLLINSITRKRLWEMWVSKSAHTRGRRAQDEEEKWWFFSLYTVEVYGSSNNKIRRAPPEGMCWTETKKKTSSSAFAFSRSTVVDLQLIFRRSFFFSWNHYHWMGIGALVFVASYEHFRDERVEEKEDWNSLIKITREHFFWCVLESGREGAPLVSLSVCWGLFADQND